MIAPTVYYNTALTTLQNGTLNIDFSQDLTKDYESEAVLLTLLNKLQSEKTETHIFKFPVGLMAPATDVVVTGAAATAAGVAIQLVMTVGEYFNLYDLVEFPGVAEDSTHVNLGRVTVISGDTIDITPYDAAKGFVAISTADVANIISPAMAEGSDGRPPHQTIPTVYTNYVHVFEDYFRITELVEANRYYTGPERTRLREEKRKMHVVGQNRAAYWSRGIANTAGSTPVYQMSGLESQITTNVTLYGATLEKAELFSAMSSLHAPMYTGGNKRLLLSSSGLLSDINSMASPDLRISTKDTTWGVSITEVQFAGKVWQMIEDPTISANRAGYGYVVHPSYMKKRVFIPTQYRMNVQPNKCTYIEDGFVSVWGLELRHEWLFGTLKPA